jgi:transcriptional regulator with XRE-family HTH domain
MGRVVLPLADMGPSRPDNPIIGDAGQKLKQVRERLGLTYREVEERSARLATVRGNEEFAIALSRLADIENKRTVPSLYRLYSLCVIYRLDYAEVLSWYGIPLGQQPADAATLPLSKTHRINVQMHETGEIQVPFMQDPGLDATRTQFLSRFITKWGKLPLMWLSRFDLRDIAYGHIGDSDWSMHPILPPGTLVVIDQSKRRIVNSGWTSEFERPIYFLEHRAGFICGWCTQRDSTLVVQSHPSSLRDPEIYVYPREIEVIGQVTFAAMGLNPTTRRRSNP